MNFNLTSSNSNILSVKRRQWLYSTENDFIISLIHGKMILNKNIMLKIKERNIQKKNITLGWSKLKRNTVYFYKDS